MTIEQKAQAAVSLAIIATGFYFHWFFGVLAIVLVAKAIYDINYKNANNEHTEEALESDQQNKQRHDILGDGEFSFDIVGEASYKPAIMSLISKERLAERSSSTFFTARLILDDDNEYDSNAVRVEIKGKTVGYIPADDASSYRKWAKRVGIDSGATCAARIDTYKGLDCSVKLDLPFENDF